MTPHPPMIPLGWSQLDGQLPEPSMLSFHVELGAGQTSLATSPVRVPSSFWSSSASGPARPVNLCLHPAPPPNGGPSTRPVTAPRSI